MSNVIGTSVRMPEKLLSLIDNFAEVHSMSRSSAINYLLTKGLFYEGEIDKLSDNKSSRSRENEIGRGVDR